MLEHQHVRILRDRPFDWEVDAPEQTDRATGEWPDSAVTDDRMSLGWGALNALAFVAAVVLFAVGVYVVATVPPGEAGRGIVGLALIALGAGVGAVAWGHARAEQERSL